MPDATLIPTNKISRRNCNVAFSQNVLGNEFHTVCSCLLLCALIGEFILWPFWDSLSNRVHRGVSAKHFVAVLSLIAHYRGLQMTLTCSVSLTSPPEMGNCAVTWSTAVSCVLPFCCLCMCFMWWKPLLVSMHQVSLVHQSNRQTESRAQSIHTRNISQLVCNRLGTQTTEVSS